MRPESSASSMNAPASSSPATGWCQRASASAPDHEARVERQLGLVVDLDLAHLDGPAQVGLGAQPLGGLGAQLLVEDLVAVTAAGLGQVHGRVGVAQQAVGGVVGRRGHGDPDADRGEDLVAVDHRPAP